MNAEQENQGRATRRPEDLSRDELVALSSDPVFAPMIQGLRQTKDKHPAACGRLTRRLLDGERGRIPHTPTEALRVVEDLRLFGQEAGCYAAFILMAFPEIVAWFESGRRVFEVALHAVAELALTRPPSPSVVVPPVTGMFVRLPSPGSLVVNGSDVALIFVANSGLADGERVLSAYTEGQDKRAHTSPDAGFTYWAFARDSIGRVEHPAIAAMISNLCTALTCRPDDLIAEELHVKIGAHPRPATTRVRMRSPRVDLNPHLQRFLLEGERAFHGKRGHHVMGFFRRPPKGESKTVWVRPHFRGGKLGDVTEPSITQIVKSGRP
jgi:hypothetical protein